MYSYKAKGIGGIHDRFSIIKPASIINTETAGNFVHEATPVEVGKGPVMIARKRKGKTIQKGRTKKRKSSKPKQKGMKKPAPKKKIIPKQKRRKDRF